MDEEKRSLPTTLQLSNQSQQTVLVPIQLNLPIILQPQVIPKQYGCEVVVPIRLKIPIALQIEILKKLPMCPVQSLQPAAEPLTELLTKPLTEALDSSLTESSQTPNEQKLESAGKLSAESADNLFDKSYELSDAPLVDATVIAASPQQVGTLEQQQANKFNISKLNNRKYRFYPITVLTLLLGTLLGTSCSSMLVKHFLALQTDQHCAIVSTTTARLDLSHRCF